MVSQYYYAREADKVLGPCSGRQLQELAASGEILPTDTIWKKGIKKGLLASNLKNLFPAEQVSPALPDASVQTDELGSAVPSESSTPPPAQSAPPEESKEREPAKAASQDAVLTTDDPIGPELREPQSAARAPSRRKEPERKKRAVAVCGAVIVGQDGSYVRYRKKCTKCGQDDSCVSRMAIRIGSITAGFFCPKCRKQQRVELRGTS